MHPETATVSRRQLLRAAGVTLALPRLPSLGAITAGSPGLPQARRRMVCIGNMLGFYPKAFRPRNSEQGSFEFGQTTMPLEPHREQLTVISGLDHDLKGGHFTIHAFLSGVRQIDAKSMPLANITVDQFAAEQLAGQTRFPSLTIGSESGIHGGCQLSWTRSGTRVPPIPGPSQLFQKLFVGTDPADQQREAMRFLMKRSILDAIGDEARRLNRKLANPDKQKLDEYLTSVREVEKRIDMRDQWRDIAKPEAPFPQPKNRNLVEDLPLLYDLMVLALQTDSTRVATLEIGGDFEPRHLGVRGGYHSLSHHGQDPARIEALIKLETYQVQQFARFLNRLGEIDDGEESLLDQTAVLFGSGMGDASKHTNTDLPLVLAGGGFKHGRHLAFDRKSPHRPPMTNLFVSMLQRTGLEVDQFSTSTGTLRGLTG